MATQKLGDITLSKQTGTTLTLSTEETYVASDLSFGLDVQTAIIDSATSSVDVDVDQTSMGSAVNIYDVIGTKSDTEPSSGYFICMNATGSGDSQVTRAGWIDTVSLGTASASATKYFPVTSGSVDQSFANTGLYTYLNAAYSDDYNISITPRYKSTAGYLPRRTSYVDGVPQYFKIKTDNPSFKGGDIQASSDLTTSTASISTSQNNSGVSVSALTYAMRNAIKYNADVSGWVAKSENATAYAASDPSLVGNQTYYINGVTLTAPSSGVRQFTVTVPNGQSTQTITFTVDSNGDVLIE